MRFISFVEALRKRGIEFPLRKIRGGYIHVSSGHGGAGEPDILNKDISCYLSSGYVHKEIRSGETILILKPT